MSSDRKIPVPNLGTETSVPKPSNEIRVENTPGKGSDAPRKAEPKAVGFGKGKSSRNNPSGAVLPLDYRRDLAKMAGAHRKKYRKIFKADPTLKDRAARFYRAQLPPRSRRGRPGIDSVTTAMRLLRIIRRRYPHETPACWWRRIYPLAIPTYDTLSNEHQRVERILLRERVKSRRNQQRKRRTQE
jgi:hypothetical protein